MSIQEGLSGTWFSYIIWHEHVLIWFLEWLNSKINRHAMMWFVIMETDKDIQHIIWNVIELGSFCTCLGKYSRGIVFTRSVCLSVCLSVCVSVCVSVCPANILVFYFSAIRRDIDLKFIQDTYRVVLNSLKKNTFIGQWSRSQGRYIAFWRYSHITKTEL